MGILDRLKHFHLRKQNDLDLPEPDNPPPAADSAPAIDPEPLVGVTHGGLVDPKPPDMGAFNPPPEPPQPFTTPAGPPEPNPVAPSPPMMNVERDVQVVIAKLDTLRAQLENVLQRLERIEQKSNDKKDAQW
ncbi:MAG: hypothetical protein QGG83_03670 [Candidatus Woesearchaeota archaeon]|jgi:hypothetical protein|nr:hypothetical protein [Candidatus Woesearchaeota archaeon]MDP7646523.1 hypothetical protein [Candidatus Woesearchaeota archaeon]